MIAYGDPSFQSTLPALAGQLRTRTDALLRRSRRGGAPLDSLRTLLIEAGQLEQAAADGLPAMLARGEIPAVLASFQDITDCAASAHAMAWIGCGQRTRMVSTALAALLRGLKALDALPAVPLIVKIPEGFAFYCLYPEQYAAAALAWLADHPAAPPERIVAIGVRSIGTTLSATVATVLRAQGCHVRRTTVRPTGHPFSRRVDLRSDQVQAATHALVVDEGPGLSGSSMMAVAEALIGSGMVTDRISFLPGHAGEPGSAATPEVRRRWAATRRYFVPLEQLRWSGRTLLESLSRWAEKRLGTGDPVERVEDVGGGQWRQRAFADAAEWPAVFTPFERAKYLCVTRSGQKMLWKFAGLGTDRDGRNMAEQARVRLARRADQGWTAASLGSVQGFIALPWMDGRPLARSDASAEVAARLGRYVAAVAGPPLTESEYQQARERLEEMVYWNLRESLGESVADRARILSAAAARAAPAYRPASYGDGRLSPHEWLRARDGRLLKCDAAGHDLDHTLVGRQPAVWDLVGAIVEWSLEGELSTIFLEAARTAGADLQPGPVMRFYRLAYAAFRWGLCGMCISATDDLADRRRLESLARCYREDIVRGLSEKREA